MLYARNERATDFTSPKTCNALVTTYHYTPIAILCLPELDEQRRVFSCKCPELVGGLLHRPVGRQVAFRQRLLSQRASLGVGEVGKDRFPFERVPVRGHHRVVHQVQRQRTLEVLSHPRGGAALCRSLRHGSPEAHEDAKRVHCPNSVPVAFQASPGETFQPCCDLTRARAWAGVELLPQRVGRVSAILDVPLKEVHRVLVLNLHDTVKARKARKEEENNIWVNWKIFVIPFFTFRLSLNSGCLSHLSREQLQDDDAHREQVGARPILPRTAVVWAHVAWSAKQPTRGGEDGCAGAAGRVPSVHTHGDSAVDQTGSEVRSEDDYIRKGEKRNVNEVFIFFKDGLLKAESV